MHSARPSTTATPSHSDEVLSTSTASTRSCISTTSATELNPHDDMAIQVDDAAIIKIKQPVNDTSASTTKIRFLDGMRGLAVIFVVCSHLEYFHGMQIGGFGVHIFFVLSAYLLTMILDRKFRTLSAEGASRRRWGYAVADYAARRILRVYPLFAMVAIYVSFQSDKHKHQWYHVDKRILGHKWSLWKVLTFHPGHYRFYVLWTLPMELTYYLIIPVFVAIMIGLKRWWWLSVPPLTFWIVYMALTEMRNPDTDFSTHLPTFVCGSIAAVIYNRTADRIKATDFQFKLWHRCTLRVVEGLVLLLLISESFEALLFDWFGPSPFRKPRGHHFVSAHVSMIIVCEMLKPSVVAQLFEWPLLRHAGKISFSVYLLHPRILFSDFVLAQKNHYTHFFCVWALVFFWGTVSYYAVERPCQLLATWIGKKIKARDSDDRELVLK